jgi:hypothetical protein
VCDDDYGITTNKVNLETSSGNKGHLAYCTKCGQVFVKEIAEKMEVCEEKKMSDMCNDNRFELIEKYKKELVEATNIETSHEEMQVLDNILFRFWQMGWLDSIDRMLLVKESAKILMSSGGCSVFAKELRNAGRFIQNAIDGEAPEFEKISFASINCSEFPNNWIPCSVKKHPDKSMYCHVTVIDDGDYIVDNDDWDADSESWNEYSDDEIIAWMPEIAPYQEAKDKVEIC